MTPHHRAILARVLALNAHGAGIMTSVVAAAQAHARLMLAIEARNGR